MVDLNDTIDSTDVPGRDQNGGAIAGIVIAVLIALILLIAIVASIYPYTSCAVCACWIHFVSRNPHKSYAKVKEETHDVTSEKESGDPSSGEMTADTGSSTSTTAGIPPKDTSSDEASSSSKASKHVGHGLSEKDLFELAEKLGNHTNLLKLALKLDFDHATWKRYETSNNRRDGQIYIGGTLQMLIDWKTNTPQVSQKSFLNKALTDAGFAEFVDSRDELLHDGKENPPKTDANSENNGQKSNTSQEGADQIKQGDNDSSRVQDNSNKPKESSPYTASQEKDDIIKQEDKESIRGNKDSNKPEESSQYTASQEGVDTVKQGDNESSRGHENSYKPEESASFTASQERDDIIKQGDKESIRRSENSNKPEERFPYAAYLEGADEIIQEEKESSRGHENSYTLEDSASSTASQEGVDTVKQGDNESSRGHENTYKPEDIKVVLVTDASGFVASHIVKKLLEKGCRVRATLRKSTSRSIPYSLEKWNDKLELCKADISETDRLEDIVRGCTHVIHTADLFPDKVDTFTDDEMAGHVVRGLLKACLDDGGVKRVIVTGSCDLGKGDIAKVTYSPKDWENLNSILKDAYSKASTEKGALLFNVGQKMELSIIRSPFVMGPIYSRMEYAKVEMVRLLMDSRVTQDIHFPMCDVRDVAEAYIVALDDKTAEGTFVSVTLQVLSYTVMQDIIKETFDPDGKVLKARFPIVGRIRNETSKALKNLYGDKKQFSRKEEWPVLVKDPTAMKTTVIDMVKSFMIHFSDQFESLISI